MFNNYAGVVSIVNSAPALNQTYTGVTLSAPAVRGVEADGFLRLEGVIDGVAPSDQYALVWVYLEADPTLETYYWVRGSFTEDVWLRFGAGDYVIKVYKTEVTADRAGEGAIVSWTYWLPEAYRIEAKNTRAEDGRYAYPSGAIQADDPAIVDFALLHAGQIMDDLSAIRALHDAVVKLIAYDFESLDAGQRRKQDAVSTLVNEIAVCEGYSTLYNALLRSIGIPAGFVSGSAGGLHAWSWVNAQSLWNYVDTTWDDPIMGGHSDYPDGANLSYDYFWKPSFADHTVDEILVTRGGEIPASASQEPGPTAIPGFPKGWY